MNGAVRTESASRYVALVGALSDAIISAGERGLITGFNAAAERIFGYAAAEVLGEPLTILMPDHLKEAHRAGFARFRETGDARVIGTTVELPGRRKDGTEFPAELSLCAWDDDGNREFTAVVRDVTERKGAEEKFRALLDSAPDAIVIIGADGRIALVNRQTEELFGYAREELFGQAVEVLVPERFRDAHDERRGDYFLAPRMRPMGAGLELYGRRWDGSEFPVEISLSPLETDEGVLAIAAIRDISERKQTEETMSRLGAIVESSNDAIVGKDLDGRIVSWNRGAETAYGYTAQEAVGQTIAMLIPPERSDELSYILDSVRRGEPIDQHETARLRKDGTRIDVSATVSPIRDALGRITGAAVVARDITDRKRAEEELRRSNEDLERFAYVASHDLTEPLRVIAGFVELLQRRYEGQLDGEADKFIRFTVEGVERMQALIDDLLAFSRAGRVALEPTELDTAALVSDVLRALEGQAAERGAQIEVGELPNLRAEPALLRQAFQNLIANAIKFTNSERPQVRVSASREPGCWRFDVEDNGPGIEARHAERIFEMFQRLTGRDTPGTGIGLAITKRVVERHGGRIWVKPAAGGGSVFSFTIPDPPGANHAHSTAA